MTVRIQAVWRGSLGRRAATALRLESSMTQATVKVQRWWRAGRRLRPVRRLGLFPAAVEKATEKIVAGQRAWRRLRRRGALALSSTVRSGFMDSEREFLSGREAQVILSESFLRPAVREMVKEPDDYTVADRLGRHWYSALRRLEVLGHGESHKSVDGRPFAVDVQEAVCIYPCGSSGSCTAARGFGKRCGTSLRVHTNRPRRASNRRVMDIAGG